MKTIEELEAQIETVTRERDTAQDSALMFERDWKDACRERDLSLAAWESAGMQGRDAQSAMLELARQLEEHREKRGMYAAECVSLRARLADAQRERDEARAEVERLREESAAQADISSSTIARMRQQQREALAEVERLKRERDAACMAAGEYSQDEVNAMTTEMIALRKEYEKSAYRRGAEAMREACEAAICAAPEGSVAELVIGALPIPEEP